MYQRLSLLSGDITLEVRCCLVRKDVLENEKVKVSEEEPYARGMKGLSYVDRPGHTRCRSPGVLHASSERSLRKSGRRHGHLEVLLTGTDMVQL